MSLYYPMSLQNLPDSMSTRQMVGMTRSMSSSHATAGSLSAAASHGHHPYMDYGHGRMSYGSGGALHPSSHVSGNSSSYLGVPLSAPASMSTPKPTMYSASSAWQ